MPHQPPVEYVTSAPNLSHVDVEWSDLAPQLLVAIIMQASFMVLSLPCSALWEHWKRQVEIAQKQYKHVGVTFQGLVVQYLGTPTSFPRNCRFVNLLFTFQWVCSTTVVVLWVLKTYTHTVTETQKAVEGVAAVFIAVHYFLNCLKHEFSLKYICGLDAVVDVVTVAPLYMQFAVENPTWISLSYLRSIRMLKAYVRLEAAGALENVHEFYRGVAVSTMKFVVLIIVLSGTMFVLEVLGDLTFMEDHFINADMGHISFYSMCYFTFVTISTVGYGDYSPVTVLGQLFCSMAIIVGVVFFSIETGNLLSLRQYVQSGHGSFKPKYAGRRPHAIVFGGAVSNNNLQIMVAFLEQLSHKAHQDGAPEVVFMSTSEPSSELLACIKDIGFSKLCTHLVGHPSSENDCLRARAESASMAFVLADMSAVDPDAEDEDNILQAAAILQFYPKLPLRLMLLRPESRNKAVTCGLHMYMVFAVNEMKANLLAHSCRAPGLSTLLVNLCRQEVAMPEYIMPPPEWMREHLDGMNRWIYGCMLGPQFDGLTFSEAARQLFKHGLVLLATQSEGRVLLNPGHTLRLQPRDVVFIIGPSGTYGQNILDPLVLRDGGQDWLAEYRARREKAIEVLHMRELIYNRSERHADLLSAVVEHEDGADDDIGSAGPLGNGGGVGGEGGGADKDAKTDAVHRASVVPGNPIKIGTDVASIASGDSGGGRKYSGLKRTQSSGSRDRSSRFTRYMSFAIKKDDEASKDDNDSTPSTDRDMIDSFNLRDHVVVLGLGFGLWQQIATFVLTLRSQWMDHVPLLVVTSQKAPRKLKDMFEQAYFLQGNPLNLRVLLRAGVHQARKIVVLNGIPTSETYSQVDRQMILLNNIVEYQRKRWGREHDLDVTYELHAPENIHQLRDAPNTRFDFTTQLGEHIRRESIDIGPGGPIAHGSGDALGRGSGGDGPGEGAPPLAPGAAGPAGTPLIPRGRRGSGSMEIPAAPMGRRGSAVGHEARRHSGIGLDAGLGGGGGAMGPELVLPVHQKYSKQLQAWRAGGGAGMDHSYGPVPPPLHHRHVSGNVIYRTDLCCFYAAAFHTPGVMEIIEGFIVPERRQQMTYCFFIDMPVRMYGSPYKFLFEEMLQDGALAVGLFVEPAVKSDTPVSYVYTCPPAHYICRRNHKVYVLADANWWLENKDQEGASSLMMQLAVKRIQNTWKAWRRAGVKNRARRQQPAASFERSASSESERGLARSSGPGLARSVSGSGIGLPTSPLGRSSGPAGLGRSSGPSRTSPATAAEPPADEEHVPRRNGSQSKIVPLVERT